MHLSSVRLFLLHSITLHSQQCSIHSLADPFTITHPTTVQTSLVSGASFARFDPSGKFLAAARSDGSAVIWDLDTRATIRWCEGHVKGVTAVECVRSISRGHCAILTKPVAGHETRATLSLHPKTGMLSCGILLRPTILLADMPPSDSTRQWSLQAFTQGTGE